MGTAWKDKLPDVLWAYRTTYKTPLGMSPYQLVYEKTCHLPMELEFKAHWTIKQWNMDIESHRRKEKDATLWIRRMARESLSQFKNL
jgi:hypothetical protein